MTARILISAGGTGGGVYPALAVASALRQLNSDARLHFVSSASGIENNLVEKSGFQFDAWSKVQGGPLHGVSLPRRFLSLIRLGIGTLQALWLLIRQRPAVVFLTGGWVGVPVAVASRVLGINVVIYVPDVEPGRTLAVLGRFATLITATVAETAQFYGSNRTVVATGYPLRDDLLEATRADGITAFGLDHTMRTLLVFGGSRGSRAINRMIYGHVEQLLNGVPDMQILHISGTLDAVEVASERQSMADHIQARYHVRDYVHEMGLALAAADLVVSRAGAATIGEFPAFDLPSILIPLAYEWHYQEVNADWLQSRGASIRVDEPDMETRLIPLIQDVMEPDSPQYQSMQTALQQIKKTDGSAAIATEILKQSTK